MQECQICGKEALFRCSGCQITTYCSRDHQQEHWRIVHRGKCNPLKPTSDTSHTKVLDIRKTYFQNFSQRYFTECLLDAKVLSGLERQLLSARPTSQQQLDFGASICVLAKTYLLLGDKKSAKSEMEAYLTEKSSFIFDMKDFPQESQSQSSRESAHEELLKKLNLISCIANLCHAIGMDCITYYVLYTKIICHFFGPESSQASNCYFLVGCYFAEEGFFKKAIECFKKSASIRKQGTAGDCYYNIGVLLKMQNENSAALQMLRHAFRLRKEHYADDSREVAEIYEMNGIIFTEMNDFKTAMLQFDEAHKLRMLDGDLPQLIENTRRLIRELYKRLCVYIDCGQPRMKRPQIYLQLKSVIEAGPYLAETNKEQRKLPGVAQPVVEVKPALKKQSHQERPKFQNNLTLTEELTSKLNLTELFRLSQLQLELQKCTTQFGVIYTIGTSAFYQGLSEETFKELEKTNEGLFKLIKLEDIAKMKFSHK